MATTRRAVNIVDENLITHGDPVGVKKVTLATTTTATRRPVLGNLANRTDKTQILNDKKPQHTNVTNDSGGAIDLKNVKARVDTHWKNDQLRKPVTRNNSVRKASLTSIGSVQTGPKLVKAKTTETAIVKEIKLIEKTSNSVKSSTIHSSNGVVKPTVLKRQDSTLTRRAKIGTGSVKTEPINKRTASRSKSNDSTESKSSTTSSATTITVVPVVQSRFRPPSSSSYSNGMLNGFSNLNIDDGDEDNTLLVCEYVNDIYAYLFEMEQKYAIRKNHLDGQIEVYPRMRTVLLDWISEVHTQYHFAQETFHITVSTIDRYLQAVKTTTRKNLQLVGVAALFIASKYEELYPPEVQDFVYITDNTYTKEQILSMEKHMLKKLKFEMGAPTAIHFLRRFSKAAQADSQTHILSKYFIELAAIDYNLSEYLPSEIAAASLFVSLCLINSIMNPEKTIKYEELWNPVLEFYSTYNVEHLRPIVKELIAYIQIAPSSKTNNVHVKYTSQKQGEMATVCDKSKHILNQIFANE